MVDLVIFYNWSYVLMIVIDEDYGWLGIEVFKWEIKIRNVCILVDEFFYLDYMLVEMKD